MIHEFVWRAGPPATLVGIAGGSVWSVTGRWLRTQYGAARLDLGLTKTILIRSDSDKVVAPMQPPEHVAMRGAPA